MFTQMHSEERDTRDIYNRGIQGVQPAGQWPSAEVMGHIAFAHASALAQRAVVGALARAMRRSSFFQAVRPAYPMLMPVPQDG